MSCLVDAVIPVSEFTIAPSLQQGFIDEATGQLLSFGVVTFYRDDDHTTLKPIYTVSGPPDSPIFTELPNPLTLSAIGTFVDPNNGQDIIPYYRPYDDAGNIDLYYITVYNSQGVLQFTRDHYPTVTGSGQPTIIQAENFFPNSQFLLHENLPNSGLVNISNSLVAIAYGGWKFAIDGTSTSTNFVTFSRFNAPSNNPAANPRYACRVRCTVADPADTFKAVKCLFGNVNFLQGENVTLQTTAYSNDGGTYTVTVIVWQNFGSGESIVITTLGTFTVTPQVQTHTLNVTIPSTIGQTLSAMDDDNLQIFFSSPVATPSDISFTDMMLVNGTFSALIYRDVSLAQTVAFGLAGSFSVPAYDGSDRGKYVQIAEDFNTDSDLGFGFQYNNPNPTGTHIWAVMPSIPESFNGLFEWLVEDGTAYPVQVQPDNLPVYSNLWLAILTTSDMYYTRTGGNRTYAYGTGVNGFSNDLIFPTLPTPPSNTYYVVWNRFDYTQPAPDPGTSGFTFTLEISAVAGVHRQVYSQAVLAASSITAGSYYILPVNTTGPQYKQLFWMTIDGAGTIPSVTADVYTRLDLQSTWNAQQVRDYIQKYANGLFQVPDVQSRFITGWNNFSGRDDVNAILREESQYNTFTIPVPGVDISYITGNSGDNIGSFNPSTYTGVIVPTLKTGDLFFQGFIKT